MPSHRTDGPNGPPVHGEPPGWTFRDQTPEWQQHLDRIANTARLAPHGFLNYQPVPGGTPDNPSARPGPAGGRFNQMAYQGAFPQNNAQAFNQLANYQSPIPPGMTPFDDGTGSAPAQATGGGATAAPMPPSGYMPADLDLSGSVGGNEGSFWSGQHHPADTNTDSVLSDAERASWTNYVGEWGGQEGGDNLRVPYWQKWLAEQGYYGHLSPEDFSSGYTPYGAPTPGASQPWYTTGDTSSRIVPQLQPDAGTGPVR